MSKTVADKSKEIEDFLNFLPKEDKRVVLEQEYENCCLEEEASTKIIGTEDSGYWDVVDISRLKWCAQ